MNLVGIQEAWLTREDVAEWLGVSTSTVDRMRRGGMPHRKFGRTIRFKRSEVERWIETR